jgi:hypothetical protein
MSNMLARREAYISIPSRKKLRAAALEHDGTISDEIATLLEDYANGTLVLGDEPEPESDEPPVRVRFKIDADVWRSVRMRVLDEDTSVSAIIRRAIAAR